MRWFKLSLFLLVALTVTAFVVQNSSRSTDLSFDAYFAAWKLSSPVSVPAVMVFCFGSGALVAWAFGLHARVQLARRVRQLEQEMALRGMPPASGEGSGAGSGDGKGGWG